jgi:hypothetical protein
MEHDILITVHKDGSVGREIQYELKVIKQLLESVDNLYSFLACHEIFHYAVGRRLTNKVLIEHIFHLLKSGRFSNHIIINLN